MEPAGWRLLEETEPPLGVFFDQSFAVQRLHLASGDMLVLSTDGLVECESAGRQFGVEGVRTSLECSRACRPGPLLDEVSERLSGVRVEAVVELPFTDGRRRAWLHDQGVIEAEEQTETGHRLLLRWTERQRERFAAL